MVLIWDVDRQATREVEEEKWRYMQVFQSDASKKTWILYDEYLASQRAGTPVQTQTSQELVNEEIARREGKVVAVDPGRSDRDYQAELARREAAAQPAPIVVSKPEYVIKDGERGYYKNGFFIVDKIIEPGQPGFVPPAYKTVEPPLVSTYTPPIEVKSSPVSEPVPTGQEKVSVDSYGTVFSPSQNKIVGGTGIYNPPVVESKPVIVPEPKPTFTEKINTSLKSVISPVVTPIESYVKPQEKDTGLLLGVKQVGTGIIGSIKEDPLGMAGAVAVGLVIPELKLGQTALKVIGIGSVGIAGYNVATSEKPVLEAVGGEAAYFSAAGIGLKANQIVKNIVGSGKVVVPDGNKVNPTQIITNKEPIGLYSKEVPDFGVGGKFDVKLNKVVSEKPQGLYDTTAKRYEGYSSAVGKTEAEQRVGEILNSGSRNPDEPRGLFSKDVPDFGGGGKSFEITIKAEPKVLESFKSEPKIDVVPKSPDIDVRPREVSGGQGLKLVQVEKEIVKPQLEELKLSVTLEKPKTTTYYHTETPKINTKSIIKKPKEIIISPKKEQIVLPNERLSTKDNFKLVGEATKTAKKFGEINKTSKFGRVKTGSTLIDVEYDYSKVYPQGNKSKVNEIMSVAPTRQQNITIQKVSPREITATKTSIGLDKGLITSQKTKEKNIVFIGTKPSLRSKVGTGVKVDTSLKTSTLTLTKTDTATKTIQKTIQKTIPKQITRQKTRTITTTIPKTITKTTLRIPKILSSGGGRSLIGGRRKRSKKFTEITGVLLPSQMIGRGSKSKSKSKSIFKKMKVGKVKFK